MAATTTYYPTFGRAATSRIVEHNAALLRDQVEIRRRFRTPEFSLAKHFDNSRLERTPDPARMREIRAFTAALVVLFSLVMVYGLQHFYTIENSYRVEQEKQDLNKLREENRQLRATQAMLTNPERVFSKAHELGLEPPLPDQVVHGDARLDGATPVVAQASVPTTPAR
jgi:cell division protein FtsL